MDCGGKGHARNSVWQRVVPCFFFILLRLPGWRKAYRFLLSMTAFPEMIRNIAVVGHLHHGKTALMDMLVFETHKLVWDADKPVSYIAMSAFLANGLADAVHRYPCSIPRTWNIHQVLPHVPYPFHHNRQIPPHTFHWHSRTCQLFWRSRFSCATGRWHFIGCGCCRRSKELFPVYSLYLTISIQLMVGTEAILRHAIQENIKITLVVNKIDRLILELRIKPADAFYKIKHTIEEINTFIRFVCCSLYMV